MRPWKSPQRRVGSLDSATTGITQETPAVDESASPPPILAFVAIGRKEEPGRCFNTSPWCVSRRWKEEELSFFPFICFRVTKSLPIFDRQEGGKGVFVILPVFFEETGHYGG